MSELAYPSGCVYGSTNQDVKKVQEWLCLAGIGTTPDSEFGPATKESLRQFQKRIGTEPTGVIDSITWAALVDPLSKALVRAPVLPSFGEVVVAVAKQHVNGHPREAGGDNRGPWVRTYCKGADGPDYQWCQGFASSMWEQAHHNSGYPLPFPLYDGSTFSLYVPWVAESARKNGKLVYAIDADENTILPGSMFFLKGGSHGYSHVGIVTDLMGDTFKTIEGNTNDDGSSNGYEACCRVRNVKSSDFGSCV